MDRGSGEGAEVALPRAQQELTNGHEKELPIRLVHGERR